MVGKMTLGSEGLAAAFYIASERLLTSMNSYVGFQVTILGEAFAADVAFEGFVSCVGSLVDLESA